MIAFHFFSLSPTIKCAVCRMEIVSFVFSSASLLSVFCCYVFALVQISLILVAIISINDRMYYPSCVYVQNYTRCVEMNLCLIVCECVCVIVCEREVKETISQRNYRTGCRRHRNDYTTQQRRTPAASSLHARRALLFECVQPLVHLCVRVIWSSIRKHMCRQYVYKYRF